MPHALSPWTGWAGLGAAGNSSLFRSGLEQWAVHILSFSICGVIGKILEITDEIMLRHLKVWG